jgi:hypothetical protein
VSSILYDSEHWLACANEARALAKRLADPETKRQMLIIALGYERIARHAEEHVRLMEQFKSSEKGTGGGAEHGG